MKRILSLCILLMSVVALLGPECAELLGAESHRSIKAQSVNSISTPESAIVALALHDSDCQGACGDMNHVSHHCHFGHCGLLSTVRYQAGIESSFEFERAANKFILAQFLSNPFRPPIA